MEDDYVHFPGTFDKPFEAMDSLTNGIDGFLPILSSRVEIPASCRAKDIVRALWPTQGMETFPVLRMIYIAVLWYVYKYPAPPQLFYRSVAEQSFMDHENTVKN